MDGLTQEEIEKALSGSPPPLEEEDEVDDDDTNDADYTLSGKPKAKPKGKAKQSQQTGSQKSQSSKRVVKHNWTHEETLKLISLVEQHPELWDISSKELKLSKHDSWREVFYVFIF